MAPKYTNRVEKTLKRVVGQYQQALSLDSQAVLNQVEKMLMELEDEKDAPQHLVARDLTIDKVVTIFGLKEEVQPWGSRNGGGDVPESLTFVLGLIKDAPFDKNSEAYSHLTIDHLIMACFAKHKKNLSKQSELLTKDPYNQITPTTPSKTPESTSQPLPIKVFHEMPLAIQVERGSKKWVVSGIAHWAIGYGDRAVLEDGIVLLVVKAKRRELFSTIQGQLLAYLATIRQLRIQANKENVITQGFYSDGENYRFICIRNDGTIMRSASYDISFKRNLKPVFNFLLGMLTTTADSLPNTSSMTPGKERDEKITNLDQDVFVRVIEDQDMYDDTDSAEEDESCRLCITEVV